MACEITVKLKNQMKSLTRVSPKILKEMKANLTDKIISDFLASVQNEFNDVIEKQIVMIKLIEE
jgi:hypothetical protein